MNKRIERLRNNSLSAINRISDERANLITDYYLQSDTACKPVAIQRAEAFRYFLQHKALYYKEGELIIGERGEAPKATPTYPEITLHSLNDLKIMNDREKVSFKASKEIFDLYRDKIIPFWEGKTNRDRLFAALDEEWKTAYRAGIFTEFQEQRAPGHTVLGHQLFEKGFKDIIAEIESAMEQLDFSNDQEAQDKRDELTAMKIAAEAIIEYAERNAEYLREIAENDEMLEIADICSRTPASAPQTFHEALQHYWFIHLGVVSELNPWDSFNPGRLDQHLYPFYQKGISEGSLTKERAIELLQAF